MATNTFNNYFSKPAVGGDTDTWGATLNANWDAVDSIVTGGRQITRLGIGTTNSTLPLICNAASATDIAASFSGSVGIGTTSPDKLLHVKDGDILIESTFPRIYLTDTDNNSDYSIINSQGAFSIYDDTNTAYRVQIDSSGNVGIGTSTILNASTGRRVLTLSGETSSFLNFGTGNTRWGGLYSEAAYTSVVSDSLLTFESNATERMRIDASGNVGIGTIAPSHTLDVYANADNKYAARFAQDHATGWGVLIDTDGTANADPALWVKNASDTILWAAQSGNVGIGTSSPSRTLDIEALVPAVRFTDASVSGLYHEIVSGDSNNLQIKADGGSVGPSSAISFDVDGSEKMCIKHTGNVGIGTDNPQRKLHVQDGDIRIESSYPRIYLTDTDHNSDYSIINANGKFLIYDDTNASNRMVIANTSGRVGIGTDNPLSKLHVIGDGKFDGGTSTTVDVKCDDGGTATLRLMGDNQGNGRVYVGQSNTFGGGIEYCGNNDPVLSGGDADHIALYRRDNGTSHWTARNSYNSNNWQFRGAVTATSFVGSFVGAGNALTSLPILGSSAVGTYAALLYYNNNNPANLNFGSVVAGSTLRHANFLDQGYGTTSQVPAGTWRLCGQTGRYHGSQSGGGRDTQGSVWLRVS